MDNRRIHKLYYWLEDKAFVPLYYLLFYFCILLCCNAYSFNGGRFKAPCCIEYMLLHRLLTNYLMKIFLWDVRLYIKFELFISCSWTLVLIRTHFDDDAITTSFMIYLSYKMMSRCNYFFKYILYGDINVHMRDVGTNYF